LKYNYLNVIGLMSGTSIDGIDISYVQTNGQKLKRLNSNVFYEYSSKSKNFLENILNTNFSLNLKRKKILDDFITKEHYQALNDLDILKSCELIGFHGQTLYHDPIKRTSVQLGNPQLLSKLLKKNVVFDFRSNDIKMGGQGAPLAPIYHKQIIEEAGLELPSCIINIGGVANITFWDGESLLGFDTGPGNALMDDLMKNTSKNYFDDKGYLASKGLPDNQLVNRFLNQSYFHTNPPKSLDRNFFRTTYNEVKNLNLSVQDKMSTLSALTVESIVLAIEQFPKKIKNVLITGGGKNNDHLMKNLQEKLMLKFITERDLNINFDFIEAELIAFLSARSVYNLPFTFPSTTGVSIPSSGGKLYKYL
jgi:anhydro-N-acetylmuramic acid kinase